MSDSVCEVARRAGFGKGEYREDLGVWIRSSIPPRKQSSPALFLDRDGVIVEETRYLSRVEDVALVPGAAETVAMANQLGVPVVVVTNQAGIGRGYYNWEAFAEVEAAITGKLKLTGASVDAVIACPFHPEGIGGWRHHDHPARKPNPGMFHTAGSLLNLNLTRSWIVGDHSTDIQAGSKAGLQGGLHVLTGHGLRERESALKDLRRGFELRLGQSIRDAIPILKMLAE